MIKTYLKRAFQLSDSGVKGLAKSIWSFFLYYVSFVPPMICVFLFADRLLNGNAGKPVVYLLFMLAATLVMYLVINYNYKTTYDETYQESANLRIDLAEQLSKLPLSYFSKHNLSDLAQTIMADVASIEHAFANAVANSIGFAIYFLVISVALLIMNWKLGLCVLLPVLTSASVLFLTKKLQVRDVNKHYDKLRDISESFQNAIELNQEIKSYGLKEKVEAQMDQQLDESENLQWKAQITQTIPVTIGQTLSILPIGITATVGLSMLASGQVSILILLGYIIMAAKLSGAMGGVLLYLTEIFYLDARIARIGEIKNHELQGGEKAVLSDFNVEIKDVCFSYQKDTQVIRHASFTAEQGQVTALVGPSGCGKTTMLMLSGGMLQRVIIAMAMMLDAKFVLADEPTTALDVIHRNGIIDLFSQMKANGVGILMVTHDSATALQLGGNVLVMKEGKIIESGEVQYVFDHTTEPYTRSLIEAYSLSYAFTKGAES